METYSSFGPGVNVHPYNLTTTTTRTSIDLPLTHPTTFQTTHTLEETMSECQVGDKVERQCPSSFLCSTGTHIPLFVSDYAIGGGPASIEDSTFASSQSPLPMPVPSTGVKLIRSYSTASFLVLTEIS